MDRARDWATRITHEAQLHERNSFINPTFADEHLPDDGGVHVRDIQLFMKRIRKARGPVRFFGCGEYGDTNWRPHYHLLIFGEDWSHDRYLWRITQRGHRLYRSPSLEKLWPFGHCEIGEVTHDSAQYVARYIHKKVNGERAREHYWRPHPVTGEFHQVNAEFITMSTRPGIGAAWFERFSCDAFPSDFVTIEGQKRAVPRYYFKKLKATEEPSELLPGSAGIQMDRQVRARQHADNNTPERLATREEALKLALANKKREL